MWKCLAAGLPALLLGAQFLFAALSSTGGWFDARDLAPLMQVEFLVLHAGIFLGAFAFVHAEGPVERAGQRLILGTLLLLYLLLALSLGWRVAVEFFLIMIGTNLGLLLSRQEPTVIVQMVARWGIGFLLFIACAQIADMPKQVESWASADEALVFGAWYFITVGLLDVSGFYLRTVPRWYLGLAPHERLDRSNYSSEMNAVFAWFGRKVPARLRGA